MRIVASALIGLVALCAGAYISLWLSMRVGELVSTHEPGAYIGVILALVATPVGGLLAGVGASTATWRWLGRMSATGR